MVVETQCLVTGGTGFIGRFVVRALLARGARVRMLCRDEAKARRLFGDEVTVEVGDLLRPASLASACRDVETIFHLGGCYAFGRRTAQLAEQTNVTGTESLLKAAWDARVECFTHV